MATVKTQWYCHRHLTWMHTMAGKLMHESMNSRCNIEKKDVKVR